MTTMKFTLSQFMELNGLEKDAAYGLITYLRKVGVVEEAGSAPKKERTRGRSEILFSGDPKAIAKNLASLKFGG
jgi:hypothetical protein